MKFYQISSSISGSIGWHWTEEITDRLALSIFACSLSLFSIVSWVICICIGLALLCYIIGFKKTHATLALNQSYTKTSCHWLACVRGFINIFMRRAEHFELNFFVRKPFLVKSGRQNHPHRWLIYLVPGPKWNLTCNCLEFDWDCLYVLTCFAGVFSTN